MKNLRHIFALSLWVTMFVTCCLAFWLHTRYVSAGEHVSRLNFDLNKFTGAQFASAPKRVTVGQSLTRTDLTHHLQRINYIEAATPQPGGYRLEGANKLWLWSRRAEFASARLEFKGDALTAIYQLSANGEQTLEAAVSTLLMEPEPLGAFISSRSETGDPLFARRAPVEWSALEGQHLYFAVVAREDKDFESHHGVNWKGFARASLAKLTGGHSGGGSSITQQVVKNFITKNWQNSPSRKLDELFYAAWLESRFSKSDIFLRYANGIYLGASNGSPLYGFSSAAEEYFGQPDPRKLSLNEACLLAIMINQPGAYLRLMAEGNLQPLIERRARLLDTMHQQWPERYSLASIAAVKQEPIRLRPRRAEQKSPLDNLSEPFARWALNQQSLPQLKGLLTAEEYARLRFYCTIDADLMREAARLIATRVPVFEKQFPAAPSDDEPRNRMLATIIALNPQNGEVLTMSGGAGGDDSEQYAPLALQAKARLASTWKPFLQALAFEQHTTLENGQPLTPATFVDTNGYAVKGWQPRLGNHPPARLRTLLAASGDNYAAFLTARLGLSTTTDFFQQVFAQPIPQPSGEVSIGLHPAMTISPLKLATAYTMFARDGSVIEPKPFTSIYLDDRALELPAQKTRSILRPESVYLTTQMLRSVVGAGADGQSGTLRAAFQQAGLPVEQLALAGKTGSGPDAVWAVSISPQLIVVAWLGYLRSPAPAASDPAAVARYEERMRQFIAGRTAGQLLVEFLKAVRKHRPDLLEGNFARPETISECGIDPATGCRSDAAGNRREVFLRGTEPAFCAEENW